VLDINPGDSETSLGDGQQAIDKLPALLKLCVLFLSTILALDKRTCPSTFKKNHLYYASNTNYKHASHK
jgi:hypothetical protein